MELIKRFMNEKNLLVICDSTRKKQILKDFNKNKIIMNISFLTLDNLLSKVTFSYDYQALYALMKEKEMNYDTASLYLSNLYLLDLIKDKSLCEKKYDSLKEIYDYLFENNLITIDKLFINDLKNKKIIIDSSYITNNQLMIINDKLIDVDYELIEFEDRYYDENKLFDCLNHENISIEVNNNIEKIASLIRNDNIDINNIKICLGSNSYYETVKRVLSNYGFKMNVKNITSIGNIQVVKDVVDAYFNNDLNTISFLQGCNEELVNKAIDCINKYALLPNDFLKKKIIKKDLNYIYKNEPKYDKAIELITPSELNKFINNDDYHVFVFGFAEGVFPNTFKDEGYFNSKALALNGLDVAVNLNQLEKKKTILTLSSIKNLYLSVSERTSFEQLTPSSLIRIEGKSLPREKEIGYSKYSNKTNKQLYSSRWDKFDKYHEENESLPILSNTYSSEINEYDNSFTGINKDKYLNSMKENVTISYSSLDNYHRCPFKYYVNDVLKFNQFSVNFNTVIGGAYHEAIEKSFDENLNRLDVDCKKLYDKFIEGKKKDYTLTVSEEYFSEKIKDELPNVIDVIEKQYQEINYDHALYERKVNKEFERTINGKNIKIVFKGFVDKLLYSEEIIEGKKVRNYAVIDYKTGKSTVFEKKYVKYGLSLQLLTYIYLENEELEKNNIEGRVGGFFLQHILTSFPKTPEDREKSLSFDGGVNLSENVMPFVKDATNGIIQNMGARTSEEKKASVDNDAIIEFINIMDEKTNEAIDGIVNAKFDIKPIRIESGSVKDGCEYCDFKDICYKKFSNYRRFKLGEYQEINKGVEENE